MKNINLKIPTSWNKLTRKQILYVCRLFLMNLSEHKFKLFVFIKFTGIKALPQKIIADQVFYFFKKGKNRFSVTPQELNWFLQSTNYLTADSNLTENKFPTLRILWKRFIGPSNKCYNINLLEFLNIETSIYAFHKSKGTKYLNQIIAILYRKQKKGLRKNSPEYNGDLREQFNDFTYQKRAHWFRLIRHSKRYAIYIFYTGCRNALIASHPNLFSSGAVSSEPVNPTESIKQTIHDLNMGDITKNPQIYNTQIWEAFGHLDQMIKNMPKNKTK